MGKKKPARKNRFKKHTRQKKKRWVRRITMSLRLLVLMVSMLAVSALFMAGYAAVTQNEYFKTQSIKVSGMNRLTRQAVLAQAGIAPGDNVLAVNLRLVRKRLLAHPWIATARVAREIPETIIIDLAENAPLAIVDLGRRFLMNTEGRIFKEHGPGDPQKLPLITGIGYGDISLGHDPLTPPMTAVLDVLNVSRKRKVLGYRHINQVDMDPEMGVTLTAWKEQRKVKMGFGDFATKYNRLTQLLPHLKQHRDWRHFSAINVINPERVVVQLGPTHPKGA